MKKIIFLLLLLTCSISQAQYTYNGKSITEVQFDKLFILYGKNIFTYKDEFYNLTDEKGKGKEYSGEFGFINGKVADANKKDKYVIAEISTAYTARDNAASPVRSRSMKAVEKGSIEAYRAEQPDIYVTKYKNSWACIINLKEEDFQEKINLPVLKLDKVKENYTDKLESYVDLFTRLNPITKEQFSSYLDKGNVFYVLSGGGMKKTSENIPCTRCSGKGKIANPDYDRKRMNPEALICPVCKGSKVMLKESTAYVKPEKVVYQP